MFTAGMEKLMLKNLGRKTALLLCATSFIGLGFRIVDADTTEITSGPFKGTRVTDTRINIKFTPDGQVTPCTKLVFIQVIRQIGTKTAAAGGGTRPLQASDFKNYPGSDKVDTWTVEHEGKFVDRLATGTEPYYGGGTSTKRSILDPDGGTGVSKPGSDGNTPTEATMTDTVATNPRNWPDDIEKVTYEFETAVFCARGDDKGKFFGDVRWTFEQGRNTAGTTTIVTETPSSTDQASENFRTALTKWTDKHSNFTLPTP
jgi:hypothetical protein